MMSQSITPVRPSHRKTISQLIPVCRPETLREKKLNIRRKLNQIADQFYKLKNDHEQESRELKMLMQRGEQLSEKVQTVRTKAITDNGKMKQSIKKEEEQINQGLSPVKEESETRHNTEVSPCTSGTEVIIDILDFEAEIPLQQSPIQKLGDFQIRQKQQQLIKSVKLELLEQDQKTFQMSRSKPKLIQMGKKSSQLQKMNGSINKLMSSRRRLAQSNRFQISCAIAILFLGIILLSFRLIFH